MCAVSQAVRLATELAVRVMVTDLLLKSLELRFLLRPVLFNFLLCFRARVLYSLCPVCGELLDSRRRKDD